MRKLLIISSAVLVLGSGSCRKEGAPFWDTGVMAPLAHTTLTVDNLVPDSLQQVNGDQSVTIVYSNDFFNFTSDSLYTIPDTTLTNSYNWPFGSLTVTPGTQLTPNNNVQQTTYAISGIDLVYVLLRQGDMNLQMKNDIRQPIQLTYRIPCAKKNGVPFDTTFYVPAAPDSLNATYLNAYVDLSGYDITMTGVAGDRVNTIVTEFIAVIDPAASGPTTIYQPDSVSVINTFSGIEPYYVRGYFGNNTIDMGPDESDFEFFRKITSGNLSLESLQMNIELENYIGMDARLYINDIYSRNTRTGNTVNLTAPIIGQAINFNRAVTAGGWLPITPYVYTYTLDNSNSNAKQLVENMPDKLGYDMRIITNPLGNVSGSNDFFFVDYPLKARLNLEMPLSFIASALTFTDTVQSDFSGLSDKEKILSGTINVHADNGLPFSTGLQVYFLDPAGFITDSVVAAPNSIASAPVSIASTSPLNTWKANGSTKSTVRIPLDETKMQKFLSSERLLIRAVFNTAQGPYHTKVYNTDKLDIRVTADINYRVEF
ncbi:MAG: hypothetical protein FD123_4010 [Bacteroidetes bacterium]|nr:MAG: hypothetical protein FD123_4010 [Bacteroidota bacterium]